jgi:GDP-D-mannose 3',5'-epimerase
MKSALVLGAGGFIGGHLVKRLKRDGFWVRGVDLKFNEHAETEADDFVISDLREPGNVRAVIDRRFDEVYQLAADMGGAGYIFTGAHDADIMHNSATINLNVADAAMKRTIKRVFYSSSACMYPAYNQEDPDNPNCAEDSAYPAAPDSEYGWEKLFSERLFLAYNRNHGMQNRVARYHNIFGPSGTWDGGKEKAPAAVCRKVAMAANDGDHRDLGRRRADPLVPLRRRMRRGHHPPAALGLRGPGQHRLGRDGPRPARSTSWSAWSPTSPARRSTSTTSPARSACAAATPTTG